MGVPTSEVGYNSATARRGDHESSYERVVALGEKKKKNLISNIKGQHIYTELSAGENTWNYKKQDDGKNGRMGSFMICTFKYYYNDKIKANETGGSAA